MIREKIHRLNSENYIGERPISFTLCIKNRKALFTNDRTFNMFEDILIKELNSFNCCSFIHLFMPEHVHLVLGGNKSDSDIKKCLEMFKQKSGFYLSKYFEGFRWQKDYYDHILRSEENLMVHLKYILNNPVRAGLVTYWKNYLFKGSTVYSLNEWD